MKKFWMITALLGIASTALTMWAGDIETATYSAAVMAFCMIMVELEDIKERLPK